MGQTRLQQNADAEVAQWNNQHGSSGVAVIYRKDDNSTVRARTRTRACVIGGHTAVVWLEGITGCVALSRVTAVEG
jgi:hypothetical protein